MSIFTTPQCIKNQCATYRAGTDECGKGLTYSWLAITVILGGSTIMNAVHNPNRIGPTITFGILTLLATLALIESRCRPNRENSYTPLP